MGGHQLLIGGDHMLSRQQGAAGKFQRGLGSANGLHHQLQLRVVLQDGKILYRFIRIGRFG